MLFYKGYQKQLPSHLTRLLQLWDFIGLPHEGRKQVFGGELPIIGFEVDPNLMRVCMSEESKLQLLMAIQDFALHGTRRHLRDFQRIAGYLNWALNVYPLTAGRLFQKALLSVNWDVERELTWVIDHLLRSDCIYFLRSVSWLSGDHSTSILRVYCDASPLAWESGTHCFISAAQHLLMRPSPSMEAPSSTSSPSVSVQPSLMLHLTSQQASASECSQTTSTLCSCSICFQHCLHSTGC